MPLPIVHYKSVTDKHTENNHSFFMLFLVFLHASHPLLQALCLFTSSHLHSPPPFLSTLSSNSHSSHVQPPIAHLSLSFSPQSAFIYLWEALTVFLWWITLSSCMLLSSSTGGEEQHQSSSSRSSICLSVWQARLHINLIALLDWKLSVWELGAYKLVLTVFFSLARFGMIASLV